MLFKIKTREVVFAQGGFIAWVKLKIFCATPTGTGFIAWAKLKFRKAIKKTARACQCFDKMAVEARGGARFKF